MRMKRFRGDNGYSKRLKVKFGDKSKPYALHGRGDAKPERFTGFEEAGLSENSELWAFGEGYFFLGES